LCCPDKNEFAIADCTKVIKNRGVNIDFSLTGM